MYMPRTLEQVLDDCAADQPTADRDQLRRTIIRAIKSCGWLVAPNGQIYNEAEGCYPVRPAKVVSRNENGFRFRRRY